jgi:TPR repeat protein
MRMMLVALVASLVGACGGGSVASAVRDDLPTADKALGAACMEPGGPAQPWTFDMDSTTRGALFHSMKKGAVVVAFDCKELRVLTTCNVDGNYEYGGYPVSFDVLDFKDADSLKASLSAGPAIAARFKGELDRGSTLFIAHGEVGMATTTVAEVTRDQLKNGCTGATHFVTDVHFGAYAMKTASTAQVGSAIEIFDQGTQGSSKSTADRSVNAGDRKACEKSAENDQQAPNDCNTVVRIGLAPIGAAREKTAEKPVADPDVVRVPPPCGPGTERIDGACKRPPPPPPPGAPPPPPVARMCRPGDAADCERQCEAGDPVSCTLAGALYEKGRGVTADLRRAAELYGRACQKRDVEGCTGLGYVLSKGGDGVPADGRKAERLLDEACRAGNGRACSGLGQRRRLAGDAMMALLHFNRGCRLGYPRACFYEASLGVSLTKDPKRAESAFLRACFGKDLRGCLGASWLLASGGGGRTDPAMAKRLLDMAMAGLAGACKQRDSEACEVLGDYHAGKYDPAVKDPVKASDYYAQACRGGQKDACDEGKGPPRRPGPPPPPPPGR